MPVGYSSVWQEGVGHDVVGQRQQHAESDQRHGPAHVREDQAADGDGPRREDDLPLALEAVGEQVGMAMMKVYSRLRVTSIPRPISSVGTQLAKP